MSDGCFPGGVPASQRYDSTSIRTHGVFLPFAGEAEDDFYLDTGDATLAGSYEGVTDLGDKYRFEGKSIDVDFSCSDGTGDRHTATTTTGVTLYVDGAGLTGKMNAQTSFACEGPGCGDGVPACTVTAELVGTEIEDVELQHRIGDGDSSPLPQPSPGQAQDSQPEVPVGSGGNCAPTCSHHECTVGGPLDPGCNQCAQRVCVEQGYGECCVEGLGWDAHCVSAADDVCGPEYNYCPEA